MNFFKKIILFGIIMVTSILGFSLSVSANEVGFSVEPVLPNNQIDAQSGYFHLLMKQGDSQKLQVKLKNTKDQEVELTAWVASAKTNVNGVVDYSDNKSEVDDSLQYDLSQLVEIEKDIVLPPNSEKIIDVIVKMPEARVEGIIAGGLTFEEKKASETENISSQTGIKNKFSYVIALLIQQEKEITIEPELSIGKVEPTQLNTKSAISAEIRNVSSVFLNNMSIAVKVTDKDSKEVIFEGDKTNLQMAPNTTMNFPLFLNGKKLEPGEYHYEAFINGTNGSDEADTKEWELSSDFTIEKEVAKELNKTDTQQKDEKTLSWWVWLLIISNILLVVALVTFLVLKNKKSKKAQKKKKRKKKKKK
ncbi:DUF916 and DUF3324 domain-containing protein [Vagococcus fluvialis]|uniref:DUF916 and DUF3324 domain-containing protein n=1 Tax=Vagococcus fluvialis TaxID=2738 RepID=UPI000A35811C|nr:DUF916 and DUF3324 domain-containing protein [Vagococcus fluvialis]MBO0419293.1 DUF916 and DUF3324 domain-containing protein [Vagococcus fluvialis]OTP32182.1 hypothetical protein A5798_002218 [Enterococcus sp. 6C8_DIV0013]